MTKKITYKKWKRWDKKFINFEEKVKKRAIPISRLDGVKFINLKKDKDFQKIPLGGGCYWIWTKESILHSLHKNPTPKKFSNGEIIYNGMAKDGVRHRVLHHLLNKEKNPGRSGISVDILCERGKFSHRKKAMSKKGKVPSLNGKKISSKELLLQLNLSNKEKNFIRRTRGPIYFRNGINIFDQKHRKYLYRIYFIVGLNSISYAEIIEKLWRREYGLPKLCSYKSGR